MLRCVYIPGAHGAETRARTLFENSGIPGYYTLATEIPPRFLDGRPPDADFLLTIHDQVPRIDLATRKEEVPMVVEVLWAVGFMNMLLAEEIAKQPLRFMHIPFRAHRCPWRGREAWRTILVRRTSTGYAIETVGVTESTPEAMLVYLRRKNIAAWRDSPPCLRA